MEPDFERAYRAHLRDEDELAGSTIRQYMARIRAWERITGLPIEEVATSPDVVRDVKAQRDRFSSAYRKGLIVTAHSVHRIGALQGRWKENGVLLVKTCKEVNESSRPLSVDQLLCLLDASKDPAEIRLTHLGGLEGMRIGESTAIRDKHWQDGWFWFRREKTGKMQELPVHPRVQAAKDQILTCSPAWPSVLQDAKERLEQKTGIRFIAHQLRKTYGQMLLDNGAPWQAVQDCLGHSLGMTGRYVAVTSKMRIEAHACLPI